MIGPAFRDRASQVNEALAALEKLPESLPFELTLENGDVVTIEENMVEERRVEEVARGEWFLPHVIEPAFGIDRIIWHIIDHAHEETVKEGEPYVILHLPEGVAPYDVSVLPLFEKDGMGEVARALHQRFLAIRGIQSQYDASQSIGRRYARADEIGTPWAVTVDHTSLEDGTVTVRRRDDQQQIRVGQDDLCAHLARGNVSSLFR